MKFQIKRVFMMAIVIGLLCNTLLSDAINATPVEENSSETDIKTTDINSVEPTEDVEILSFTDNQKPDLDMFTLHININIPKNSDRNTLTIQLPEGVKVSSAPSSHLLTKFETVNNTDGSTSAILALAKTEDEAVLADINVELSQGDVSRVLPYVIHMEFAGYGGVLASKSKNYTAAMAVDKDIIAVLGESVNTFKTFPVKQGDKNVLLSQLEYRQSNKALPAYEYAFDFTKNVIVQAGSKPYTSLFQINRVVFNKDEISNSFREQSFTFFYTTNKNRTETTVNMMSTEGITLSKGEYITSYRLSSLGSNSLNTAVKTSTLFSFYGDVLINGNNEIEAVKQKGFITLPKAPDEFSYEGNDVFTAVNVIISPYTAVIVEDIFSVNKDEIFPGQTKEGTIVFKNEITDTTTYNYIENQQTRIVLTALRNTDTNLGDVNIQYTTKDNLEVTKRLLESGEELVLTNDDYFTSLKFTRENFGVAQSSLKFDVKLPIDWAPDSEIDIKNTQIFEVVDTLNTTGNVTIEKLSVKDNNVVKQSAGLYYNEINEVTCVYNDSGAPCVNNIPPELEADSIITLPLIFHVEGSIEGVAQADKDVVINPTFFIEIPEHFDFEGMEFSGSLANKKPEILTFLNDNGKRYAKVRFFGDYKNSSSETSFCEGSLINEIAVKFKVKKSLKGVPDFTTEKLDTLVDNRESLNRYKNTEMRVKSSIYSVVAQDEKRSYEYKEFTFTDSSIGTTFNIPIDAAANNKLRYAIKKIDDVAVETTVNKEGETVGRDNVSIRSEEKFEGNVKVLNGSKYDMENFVMYIPIPQGSGVQKDEWGVKLAKTGASVYDFEIYVSKKDKPNKNELNSATGIDEGYVKIDEIGNDLSEVKMIKLKAKKLKSGREIALKGLFTNKDTQMELIEDPNGLNNETRIEYAYSITGKLSDDERIKKNEKIHTKLTNTIIKGTVFVDENKNNGIDDMEERIKGVMVTLKNKDNDSQEGFTDVNGNYSFTVPSISSVDYVSISNIENHILIEKEGTNVEFRKRSYFDKGSKKAIPTLANAEYLNAGYYKLKSPDYYIEIPEKVELKNKEGDWAETDVEISLDGDKIDEYASILPKIDAFPSPIVTLTRVGGNETYVANVFNKNDELYEDTSKPITSLSYRGTMAYTLSLKTKKDSGKKLGVYEGILQFTFKYQE